MSYALFYTPPRQESFAELRCEAMRQWSKFDNEFGYVDEKIGRIKGLPNEGCNFMNMLTMFHPTLQKHIFDKLSDKTKQDIMDRLGEWGYYLFIE